MSRDMLIGVFATIVFGACLFLVSKEWVVLAFQMDPLSFISSLLLVASAGIAVGLIVSSVHKTALDARIKKAARQTIAEEVVPIPLEEIDKLF